MTEKPFDNYITEDEHYLCCVDEVGDVVKRIVRNFQMIERDQIKPLGFTMSQAYCLIELLKHELLTMQNLSEKMKLNSSTMTRIVDKLVRDGYITRIKSLEDKRIVLVKLTENGVIAATKIDARITAYYENITRHLPKGRIDEVLEAVSLLMDAFDYANPVCC